ncbi:MAG: DUF3852 domain-containing protein [Clostridiales bacterium]|jgi:hypothetical protein|nr:DUF3852 domain-containing protein [Clostridiales bacterium]
MKTNPKTKINKTLIFALIISVFFSLRVYASSTGGAGNITSAIENTWNSTKTEIKNVADKVVFPALSLVLLMLFFVKLAGAYFDYRKHGQFEFTAPLILFVCLVFTLVAPQFIWAVIGM